MDGSRASNVFVFRYVNLDQGLATSLTWDQQIFRQRSYGEPVVRSGLSLG